MGDSMKINGLTVLLIMITTGLAAYVISLWKTEIYNRGYWHGRATGWDMHRRMINIKNEVDRVFDYEQD
jgi:hypothetical protein